MRKFKRVIHKQFGGLGNFFAMIVLVAVTVIFINTYVLTKRDRKSNTLGVDGVRHRNVALASNESPNEKLPNAALVVTPNRTVKPPVDAQPGVAPQVIKRSSTPDAGKSLDRGSSRCTFADDDFQDAKSTRSAPMIQFRTKSCRAMDWTNIPSSVSTTNCESKDRAR